MALSNTPLLGLALPVDGTETGTWGDDVNGGVTTFIEAAVSGALTLTVTTSDITLSILNYTSGTPTLTATSAQYATLVCSGAMTALRNINLPNSNKIYTIINNCTGGFSLVFRGVTGPTTGVMLSNGEQAIIAWNGSDFVKLGNMNGAITPTTINASGAITGAGTGLTGTAAGLTAGTATTATTANALNTANGYTMHALSATTGTFSGNVSMPSYTVTSDIRLKSDIREIISTGAILDATKVYEYTKNARRQFGMIAQEAQNIVPIMVHEEDSGFLSIEMGGYIPLLVAEVKALRARIAALESAK